ncbi:MAG: trypsin-like peptidase domain-containing protein [Caldilineaceae bacterium]|nr:trypsin-like peptidase domain-containing protein [Caldilineaceae bacterium]
MVERTNTSTALPPLHRFGWLIVTLLLAVAGLSSARSVQAIERGPLNNALLATVQVIVPVAAEKDTYSTGSGTILTESGLILTNFHVMGEIEKETLYNGKGFAAIGINPTSLRGRPVLKYAAHLLAGSPSLDLALLRITGLLEDESAPLPENLGLTAIDIGDSQALQIGDEIDAFGFPSIGGDTVTFTSGIVSGFEDEDDDGYAEWLKVDLNINHGNSGGLATNSAGEFVGVPTQGRQDLGMIGFVRDGNMAIDWVRRALLKEPSTTQADPNAPGVSNVLYAKAITSKGVARSPGVRFDSGLDTLYATLDYANFQDGATFNFTWYRDGFQIFTDGVRWEFGKAGSTWVNVYDEDGLPDGFYELEIVYDGEQIYRDGVVVGAAQQQTSASFGSITFAENVTEDDEPVSPGTNFADLSEIYAFFGVNGVENGTKWSRRWYIDGEMVSEGQDVWKLGAVDSTWVSLSSNDGTLPVGRYRLELLLEDKVVQSGEMDIVQPAARAPTIADVTVVGTVKEADNRRKNVAGATIFFLNPGVSTETFLDDPKQGLVFAQGVSDSSGSYQLDKKVTPGTAYGVIVYKEGYKVVEADGFEIPIDATNPYEVTVTMERR